MADKIASLVTENGEWLPVKKRTAAVIAEIYKRADRIEAGQRGRLEIIVDFSPLTLTASLREVGESKRIE